MKEYRHGAHAVFEIHLHLVWTTKYRQRVLAGEVGLRVRELIREVSRQHEVTILRGHVSSDHVHLLVSIPPQVPAAGSCSGAKGAVRTTCWRSLRLCVRRSGVGPCGRGATFVAAAAT